MRALLNLPIMVVILLLVEQVNAHEPLFGLGPHTIYQYGYALETEFEQSDAGLLNRLELLYGITADWAVTASLPYAYTGNNRGVNKIVLRTKYRFFRHDKIGASKQLAVHAGISLPIQNLKGSKSVFAGLSYGYESRRHYFFSGIRYRFNGWERTLKRGNIILTDVAYGIRPWLLEYLQPDPVFLLELNTQWQNRSIDNGKTLKSTGGYIVSLSPGLLFSYRNIMLKTGIKIPIINGLNGGQKMPGKEYIIGIEFHFPPIF